MDAFDVLGLAPSFDLDPKLVEQRYRDLQRALHPDKFAQAAASERRASLARAVTVNDAYRTLRDDLKRAELLLQRYGASVSERSPQPADPELLMEVMELREQLSETKHAPDGAQRDQLAAEVTARHRASLDCLRKHFEQLASGHHEALGAATRTLSRLRYYRRFLDEVAVLEDLHDEASN